MYYSKGIILKKKVISAIQLIFGGLLTFFFGIFSIGCTIDGTDEENGLIITSYIITAIGIKLLSSGIQNKKLIKNYMRYMDILPTKSTCSILWLANEVGTSTEIAKNNLKKMINKNYFVDDLEGVYINVVENVLIFPNYTEDEEEDYEEEECCHHHHCCEDEEDEDEDDLNNDDNHTNEIKAARCPNCGGITKVMIGEVRDCEYCGSQIIVRK